MLGYLITGLMAILICLRVEYIANLKARRTLKHVIHVNGSRGKSTVTRLIDAGLRAGGFRVYSKITGTEPAARGVDGNETVIRRRGPANIREQLRTVRSASRQKADILVVECMALHPELQRISQERMLQADIGVITNVRRDHLEIMGPGLREAAEAMASTIPENGTLVTSESDQVEVFRKTCGSKGTKLLAVHGGDIQYKNHFAENVEMALTVCELLGVDRHRASRAMSHYSADPGVLQLLRLNEHTVLLNGLSANDPDSTEAIHAKYRKDPRLEGHRWVLLFNGRQDRSARTDQFLRLMCRIPCSEVWLLGKSPHYMKKKLASAKGGQVPVQSASADMHEILQGITTKTVVFAIGNYGAEGRRLTAFAAQIGEVMDE